MPRPEPVIKGYLAFEFLGHGLRSPELFDLKFKATMRFANKLGLGRTGWRFANRDTGTQRFAVQLQQLDDFGRCSRIALPRWVMPWQSARRSGATGVTAVPTAVSNAAEPGHAQHPLREHVGHARAACDSPMSMWIGLWSPEAPPKRASTVRSTGGSCSAGSSSPICTESKVGLVMSRSCQFRHTRTVRNSATSSSRWLVAREVLTTNSSAPFFLS